jgi:hypothetical protein
LISVGGRWWFRLIVLMSDLAMHRTRLTKIEARLAL